LALEAYRMFPLRDEQFVKVVFLSIVRELPPVTVKIAPIEPLQLRKSEELTVKADLRIKLKKPVSTMDGVEFRKSLFW
jgi:hypothetical protein